MPRPRIFKFIFFCTLVGCLSLPFFARATTVLSPIIELALAPGETQKVFVKVLNETSEPLYLKSSIEGFTAGGEDGKPRYVPPEQSGDYLDWITLGESSIVVQPKQIVAVPALVAVPKNATPGGYYAVVFWQTNSGAAAESANIGIASKVGTLVMITVTGQFESRGEITSLTLQPTGAVLSTLPDRVSVRFANAGNVHLRPTGTVVVRKGDTVIATYNFNQGGSYVLPQSTRRFDVVTNPQATGLVGRIFSTSFGRYQLEATVRYEEAESAVATQSISVLVIPVYGIGALSILLIVGIILFRFKHRIIRSS